MKRKNGNNIITSDDVTILGENLKSRYGKTLENVLEKMSETLDSLKSNVKWLYKYGGVGGSGGGGGSTITDKWVGVCTLGGNSIPETSEDLELKSIIFESSGKQKIRFHINNPNGDIYTVVYTYNGGKSRGNTVKLEATNRWTWEEEIDLQENGNIHISIMNGDLFEKTYDAKHIVNAFSILAYLVDDSDVEFQLNGSDKYDLFISNVKERGLRYVIKYNSSINTPVKYYYTKFKSDTEIKVEEGVQFISGQYQETLLDVNAFDDLLSITDSDAALYIFKMRIMIGSNVEIIKDIVADLLPNGIYLKVVPSDSETVLYTSPNLQNPRTLVAGNKSFILTPYNGYGGGNAKITAAYEIDDIPVKDSVTGYVLEDTVLSGKSFYRTFLFLPPNNSEGTIKEHKIKFTASMSGSEQKYIVYYYYYVTASDTTIDWFNTKQIGYSSSSAFYRYGDSKLNEVKLERNGSLIDPTSYIIRNIGDKIENDFVTSTISPLNLELIINIGIQYNYINNEELEVIEIPNTELDPYPILIYQNAIKIGESQLQGVFFIEEEENYDVTNNLKYHLLTIARKHVRTLPGGNNTNLYEISAYIDGVLVANTISHIQSNRYASFELKEGNYSINLLDITYYNNGSLSDAEIVLYWYAYQSRILGIGEDITRKNTLLNVFRTFTLHLERDIYRGHISIGLDKLSDLVLNIKVPVLCIEYEPSSNKNLNFFEWSDHIYDSDSHNSEVLTVGLKWSNGTGNANTTLNEIDSSSVLLPNGSQKAAKFTLDILGSTTRTYKSKNYTLGIEFVDADKNYEPVFTPWFNADDGKTFLPENSFTLKADIVDSAHTNNTCIGKFVNDYTTRFDGAKQRGAPYPNHIKNCLEGFPCLVFLHVSNSVEYYYLGIYNFNLGRTSNFNLAYSDMRALPTPLKSSTSDVYDFNIYAVLKTTTLDLIGSEIKLDLIVTEIDGNIPAYFDFSQYDDSMLFPIPNINDVAGFMFSEIVSGKTIEDPDTKEKIISNDTYSAISTFVKRTSRCGGYIFDKLEKGFFDNVEIGYNYTPGKVPNSKVLWRRIKHGDKETFELIDEQDDFIGSDLLNFILPHTENEVEGVASYCDYRSLVEYYTICMAFGLLDSVKKNLNIKTWDEGKTFYLAFYDMDTCLGINNDGNNVSYYAYSDYWEGSSNDQPIDRDIDGNDIYEASAITVHRDYAPPTEDRSLYDAPSSYLFAVPKYAKSIIQYYKLLSNESNYAIDSIITPLDLWAEWRQSNGPLQSAEYFLNHYYKDHMKDVDELMFNYNYRAKYFTEHLEGVEDDPNSISYNNVEAGRFRGRSIGYTRDWLMKRFHILDAYFNLLASLEIIIDDGERFTQEIINNPSPEYKRVYEQYPVNRLLLSYSDDVNIKRSIFGTGRSYSGNINLIVQAPDYTPIIVSGEGGKMYRFLLLESSKKYRIFIENPALTKLVFGGSSTWTYIDSINSIAYGDVYINSNKLLVLNGDLGEVTAWSLKLPALKTVKLNSSGYTGDLEFDRNSDVYNLTDVDISGSKINLTIDNKSVKTINLSNVVSGKVEISNCRLLEDITFNNSQITTCSILPVTYIENGGTLELSGNNITNLQLKTSNNLNLKISGDNSLTTLSIEGFRSIDITNCPNLKTILSSGNALVSVITRGCTGIETISLTVDNCTTIDIGGSNLDGSTKLTSLTLSASENYDKLSTLLIPKSKLTTISYKQIKKNGNLEDWYTTSLLNAINLTPLIYLDSFSISENDQILYIIFPNNFERPIPIKYDFRGCSELLRIYGCVKIVNTNNTFRNLNKFSIHGIETLIGNVVDENTPPTQNNGYWYIGNTNTQVAVSSETGLTPYIKKTTTIVNGNQQVTKKWYVCSLWNNYNKIKVVDIDGTDYSIVQTPLLLLSNETENLTHDLIIANYNQITKLRLFLEGDYVTNIFFDNTNSLSGSFNYFLHNTAITLFDVYYLLNSFGLSGVSKDMSVTNGSFYGTTSMFNYDTGNLFNRYTFYKCGRLVSFAGSEVVIFNTSRTLWYSPNIDLNEDNGLFSPLINLRLIYAFSGPTYISRYVLRRSNPNEKYPQSGNSFGIYYLSIAFIHDNIDQYKVLSQVPVTYTIDSTLGNSITQGHEDKLGNMTDIFKLTRLTVLISTFLMPVINYSTLTIPKTIQSIVGTFSNSYGFGVLDWDVVFGDTGNYNNLTEISNSFILSGYLGESRVRFELFANMFQKMTKLLYLGYRYYSNSVGGAVNSNANSVGYNASYGFRGAGFNKVLRNGEFPYTITSYIKGIINFVGIFSEVYRYSRETMPQDLVVEFPKNMFSETTKLENISNLFANSYLKLKLTSKGFINCPKLNSVTRLFYLDVNATEDESVPRMLHSVSIPYKFFSLGETSEEFTIYGTDIVEEMEDDMLYERSNHLLGQQFQVTPESTAVIRRLNPIKSIIYGSLCFYGLDKIHYYEMDSESPLELKAYEETEYPNNNYYPFKYYKRADDGVWHTRAGDSPKYTRKYDISKIYDGNPSNLMSLNPDVYCEDSDDVLGYGTGNNQSTQKTKNIVNYFCPPDLFNSFVNLPTLNINGMFKWCGCGGSNIYGYRQHSESLIKSNMSGRICPYLFDTVSNILYLVEFFENCKGISSYVVGNSTYMIPPKLFEKTTNITRLAKTFAGMYFDTINYAFLTPLIKKKLDIRGIFSMCFYGQSFTIANIFLKNNLSDVSGAFCVREVTLSNNLNTKSVTTSRVTGGGISVLNAANTVLEEPTTCTFSGNITTSQNSSRNIINSDTYLVYYGVNGVSNTTNTRVTNESVLQLNNNYNLHN